jgi:hypothetical protein
LFLAIDPVSVILNKRVGVLVSAGAVSKVSEREDIGRSEVSFIVNKMGTKISRIAV